MVVEETLLYYERSTSSHHRAASVLHNTISRASKSSETLNLSTVTVSY